MPVYYLPMALFSDKDINILNYNEYCIKKSYDMVSNKLSVNIDKTSFMMYHSGLNKTSLTDFSPATSEQN